jgi:hypothetical protein
MHWSATPDWIIAALLLPLCCGSEDYRRTDRYSVLQRVNDNKDSLVVWVPVILEHEGHKYLRSMQQHQNR